MSPGASLSGNLPLLQRRFGQQTLHETLKEVKRCTRDQITINTFMLERSPLMASFISEMSKLNKGRAFFATPDRLGEYILVDYVTNRRSLVT